MRIIIIILISITGVSSASAQIYTDRYIKDANKVGLMWLSDINNNKYESAYSLLAEEGKAKYPKEAWIMLLNDLMVEFGNLENRSVTQKNFQSQIEGLEDGFYVFIEYNSQYENTKEHTEYLLLKQNDKSEWKILDYSYEFKDKDN